MFSFRMTGRSKVLAYRQGYHGSSGLAALATGSDAEGWFDHYLLPKDHSVFFETYGDITLIEKQLNQDCACVILEPMNYETFAPAPPGFLEKLSELCKKRGTLLILDETRTGLGRSGRVWMTSHYNVEPDILILGKGLGGGIYPCSALLTTEPIYDKCMNTQRWGYMASMAGSPIGARVAAKVLEIAQRPALLANVAKLQAALIARFTSLCQIYPDIFNAGTVMGGIGTIGLVSEEIAAVVRREIFKRNVLAHSVSEISPRVVKFFPCLTSDVSVVDEIANALADFAATYRRENRR
jgi:acetylornithine aminotransferase